MSRIAGLLNSGMPSSARLCILVALAGTSVLCLHAGSIDAIYAFGDSLSDVGNVYTATGMPGLGPQIPGPPYVNGQFTNGNVWVQDLAADLHLAPLTPSLLGGTDYAYGGAETGVTPFNTSNPGTDLLGATGQLSQFQATHTTADPNALYTIWIGSNDLFDMLANATPAQYTSDIGAVAANIDTAINTLAGLGAKDFLVLTVPDLGIAPEALAEGSAAAAAASEVSAAFDGLLVNGAGPIPSLSALGAGDAINISVLNTYALLDGIVANPGKYGLTNVTQPCLTGAINYSGGTVCATPNQYLFWDELHPTAAGHAQLADAALDLVAPEPNSISMIAIGLLTLILVRRYRSNRLPERVRLDFQPESL